MKRFLLAFVLIAGTATAFACTNFIVTKGASTDGSVMVTYAADSHQLYGALYKYNPAKKPAAMMPVYEWDSGKYLGDIPQLKTTYATVGNMNEHSVIITETTFGGRTELIDPTGLIDYGSLMFMALERSTSAREAIKIMADLVEEYGYGSDGETFSISDANEVWYMEIIGKGYNPVYDKKSKDTINADKGAVWVAIRIPDGYVSGHANAARITKFPLRDGKKSITDKDWKKLYNQDVEVIYKHDIIDFARRKKYFIGKDADFDFSAAFAPVDFSAARICDLRVWMMFNDVCDDMDQYWDYATGYSGDSL